MVSAEIKLLHAADSGQLDVVKSLIAEGGVNINAPWKKKDGRAYNPLGTPLLYAARSGHLEIVQFLLDNGADINAKDIEDWSALHYCCNNGHEDIAAYLVTKGIDITPKDSYLNQTALEFARYRQFHNIVQIIDPNQAPFVRSAKDINKNGVKAVFARNSKHFLFRYLFAERDAEKLLLDFRRNPNQEPLTLHATDSQLFELPVMIIFDHDFETHRKRRADSAKNIFIRSSTISTNEHITVLRVEYE